MPRRLMMAALFALALAAGTTTTTTPLHADDRPPAPVSISPFASPPPRVPVEAIAPGVREKVQRVLDKPTLSSRSIAETVNTDHAVYRYLLEHPDHTVKLWRRLGAKVSEIDDRGSGTYLWHDDQGSEVSWTICHRGNGLHVWYAE